MKTEKKCPTCGQDVKYDAEEAFVRLSGWAALVIDEKIGSKYVEVELVCTPDLAWTFDRDFSLEAKASGDCEIGFFDGDKNYVLKAYRVGYVSKGGPVTFKR